MNVQRLARFVLVPLIALLTLGVAPFAAAQSSEGLQVKPAIIEDNVRPADSYEFSITVTNIAASAKTFTLSALDITGIDDQGLPVFAAPGEATPYSLSSWITLPPAPMTLEAGESKSISFSVRVPPGASPGAHFGGVFFETGAQRQPGNVSTVGLKVGTIISLQIAGTIIEDARMREFSTDGLVYGAPHVIFNTRTENLGNVLVRPHGIIEISNMFGKKVASIRVNEGGSPVFPGSVRGYFTEWLHEGFAIGRYQAVVSLTYGTEGKKTISDVTSFWVLPLKPIAAVLGLLLGLILALFFGMRLYVNNKLRAMGVAGGKAGDRDYYAKKYTRSGSRLVVAVFVMVLLCVFLFAALFLMFA